jgi:hypothetical protein
MVSRISAAKEILNSILFEERQMYVVIAYVSGLSVRGRTRYFTNFII